jgi:hypothetical protein
MTRHAGRSMLRAMSQRTLAAGLAIGALALPFAACGSSKPSYCKTKDTLTSDINALPDKIKSNGVSGAQSSLDQIEASANKLVSSAKSDFPTETKAISNSVKSLKASVSGLGSSPSAQSLLAVVPQAQAVLSSLQAFNNAAKSKCD